MRMSGFCALRNRAVPVIDPHVPAPATKCVIRPAVWAQSSGPVVFSWAQRVVRVGVLVGPERVELLGQPLGDRVVARGVVGRDGDRAHDDLGAVRPQQRDLLRAPPCRSSRTRTGSRAGRRRWPARRRCCRWSARRSCRPAAAGRRARRRGSSPAPAGPWTTRRGSSSPSSSPARWGSARPPSSASSARAACGRSGRSPNRRSPSPGGGRRPCPERTCGVRSHQERWRRRCTRTTTDRATSAVKNTTTVHSAIVAPAAVAWW